MRGCVALHLNICKGKNTQSKRKRKTKKGEQGGGRNQGKSAGCARAAPSSLSGIFLKAGARCCPGPPTPAHHGPLPGGSSSPLPPSFLLLWGGGGGELRVACCESRAQLATRNS
jgi:hypothetical protein